MIAPAVARSTATTCFNRNSKLYITLKNMKRSSIEKKNVLKMLVILYATPKL